VPVTLTKHAKEKSTYIITASFTDEEDDSVVPVTIDWTLSTAKGTVVNSRSDVAIAVPAAEVEILLSGDDLQILSDEVNQAVRLFTVNATYDSVLGTDLPLKGSIRFIIDNLRMVS
jgi:predicted NAD/FAD-dependent oxidoreductase